jgi:hypothetical protein
MLSKHDLAILEPDKVVIFLRVVDARDRHDLETLLENVTTESRLTNTRDNVRTNVTHFTKRKQWLGDEEKKTLLELTLRMRARPEDHQSRFRNTMAEKGLDPTVGEQILKGWRI